MRTEAIVQAPSARMRRPRARKSKALSEGKGNEEKRREEKRLSTLFSVHVYVFIMSFCKVPCRKHTFAY